MIFKTPDNKLATYLFKLGYEYVMEYIDTNLVFSFKIINKNKFLREKKAFYL